MQGIVLQQIFQLIAQVILGSDVFERILASVKRWADREIAAHEKREGVLNELVVIGLNLSESAARFGIELAVQWLKKEGPAK